MELQEFKNIYLTFDLRIIHPSTAPLDHTCILVYSIPEIIPRTTLFHSLVSTGVQMRKDTPGRCDMAGTVNSAYEDTEPNGALYFTLERDRASMASLQPGMYNNNIICIE